MSEIVCNIKFGRIDTFQMVYRQYHPKLYFYVLKHTKSPYLAEETVQLTFIKLWERRTALSDEVDISLQIFRIAKSLMFDLLRKETSTRESMAVLARDNRTVQADPEVFKRAELQDVYEAIEQMSPVRQKIFKLSRIEGLPYKDIAEQLSISPKTVENHIGRALRELKNSH